MLIQMRKTILGDAKHVKASDSQCCAGESVSASHTEEELTVSLTTGMRVLKDSAAVLLRVYPGSEHVSL